MAVNPATATRSGNRQIGTAKRQELRTLKLQDFGVVRAANTMELSASATKGFELLGMLDTKVGRHLRQALLILTTSTSSQSRFNLPDVMSGTQLPSDIQITAMRDGDITNKRSICPAVSMMR